MSQYTAFELDTLFEYHFFSNLDYFFARSMKKAFDETNPIVLVSCALVSKVLSEGHICLDIIEVSNTIKMVSDSDQIRVKLPDKERWVAALNKSEMVSDNIQTPLVLDSDHRLYLSKYYDFQNRLALNIAQRALKSASSEDVILIDTIFESHFPDQTPHDRPQKKAVKNAVLNYFTMVSGGPGTGKTHVTSKIQNLFSSYTKKCTLPEPRVHCVAPTGKAASKMTQGSTIHSLLKPLKNTPGFYYNKKNLLQTDMIIIDEASMIDIVLLTRLLEAVPMTARVILLGDKHQLTSIQAGSVFSDICRVKGLSSHLFFLEFNFRSKGKTGIENLSNAIKKNDAVLMDAILTSGRYPDVMFEDLSDKCLADNRLYRFISEGFQSLCNADTIETALQRLDDFKILCAHNSGEYGTLQINHVCEKILRSEDNFDIQGEFFKRLIMVTANDYKKGLFNGDTGIVYEKDGERRAVFKQFDDTKKRYRYADLPGSVPAYAITIHKSQGSEFDTVLIVLPDRLSPVITRQLLYTGVTRAKKKVIVAGNLSLIKQAIGLSIKRNSGLAMKLEKAICTNKQKQ